MLCSWVSFLNILSLIIKRKHLLNNHLYLFQMNWHFFVYTADQFQTLLKLSVHKYSLSFEIPEILGMNVPKGVFRIHLFHNSLTLRFLYVCWIPGKFKLLFLDTWSGDRSQSDTIWYAASSQWRKRFLLSKIPEKAKIFLKGKFENETCLRCKKYLPSKRYR